MSEDPKKPDDAQEEEEARAFVLSRRARFVAAAMAGVGAVASCGGETRDVPNPQPCLKMAVTGGMSGTGNVGTGGIPQPCLTNIYPSAGGAYYGTGGIPQPCLTPQVSPAGGYFGAGGIPQPCLEPPRPDSGGYPGAGGTPGAGGMPQVCLGMAATGGAAGSGGAPETDGGESGGAGGSAGASGAGGIPQPCLSVPAFKDVPKK